MGAKRLTQEEAIAILRSSGAEPLQPFEDTKTPWPSLCLTCGRHIQPRLGNIRNGSKPCRYCALGGVSEAEALALITRFRVAPVEPYPGFKEPWKCKCLDCGRAINVRLKNAQSSGQACNFCKGLRNDSDDVSTLMRANDLEPLEPYKSANAPWLCKCLRCGRETSPSLRKVQKRGHQCGWCARTRLDPNEAREILRAANVEPIGDYPGSSVGWESTCNRCGRKVFPKVAVVNFGIGACVYCGGHRVDADEAREVMLSHGVEPLENYPGAAEPWKCTCLVCFREISPAYANVSKGHAPCVYCARKRVDPSNAIQVALSRSLEPLEPYPGAVSPWLVKCMKCGQATTTSWTILNAKSIGSGCSSCTSYGFKPAVPTFVYLIENPEKDAYKVGIANVGSGRMKKHRLNGWMIQRVYKFEQGSDAYRLEQETVRWLRRELLIPPAFRKGDGWTETVPRSAIELNYLAKRLETEAPAEFQEIEPASLSNKD